MEWKVSNALSRDIERQQLNKILADIKTSIAALKAVTPATTTPTTDDYNPSTGETTVTPNPYTLKLEGDVGGSAKVMGEGTTVIRTILDPDLIGVEEAPQDNQSYWRRNGEWAAVPDAILSVADIDFEGLVAIVQDPDTYSYVWTPREIEGTTNEIDVIDGNAVAGNPTLSLADLTDTNVGTFKLLTRDNKGRLEGTVDGTAADIPYDPTTSGLVATDVQGAVDELAANGASIALSGRVADYASLPAGLGSGDAGKAYLVTGEDMIYVWSGSAFPAQGAGLSAGSKLRTVVKAADESRASVASGGATQDAALYMTLQPGVYRFELDVYLDRASGTASNHYMSPNFSGNGTVNGFRRRYTQDSTTGTDNETTRSGGASALPGAIGSTGITPAVGMPGNFNIVGAIVVTSAGTFGLNWAQNTSSATASIVRAGSMLRIVKA